MFDAIRRHGARDRVVAAGMNRHDRDLFDGFDGAISASTADARTFYLLHKLRLARFWSPSAHVVQVPEHQDRLRVVSPRFVQDARRHGVPVHVWTVNEAADMRRLLDWGVDGIITDRPDRAVDVFAERFGRPRPG